MYKTITIIYILADPLHIPHTIILIITSVYLYTENLRSTYTRFITIFVKYLNINYNCRRTLRLYVDKQSLILLPVLYS